VPIFKYNVSLTKEEGKLADDAYSILEEFELEPTPRAKEVQSEVDKYEDVVSPGKDGLPF